MGVTGPVYTTRKRFAGWELSNSKSGGSTPGTPSATRKILAGVYTASCSARWTENPSAFIVGSNAWAIPIGTKPLHPHGYSCVIVKPASAAAASSPELEPRTERSTVAAGLAETRPAGRVTAATRRQ
jgi:hypothetical protein